MTSEQRDWWNRGWEHLHGVDLWRASPAVGTNATIKGTKGDDQLTGTDGDDVIDGRAGADTLAGGLGNDVYIVDNPGDTIQELPGEGLDTVRASVSHVLAANVEQLTLTGTADLVGTGNEAANLLKGNVGHNDLYGLNGNDTLAGNEGNDTLDGGNGADHLVGGAGDDTYFVDDPGDKTVEKDNGGIDTIVTSVDWKLARYTENLVLGGGPSDALRGMGNALDNVIEGDIGENYIDGGAGNDTITGGAALAPDWADTLIGGEGDDSITAATGGMEGGALYGGTGNDTLRAASATLYGEDGDDLLYGGPGFGHQPSGNTVYGGVGNDTIEGGGFLFGGEGNDLMSTGTGNRVEGGMGDDTLNGFGGSGFVTFDIDMGRGNDHVDATAINNKLTILGGDGNDVLDGEGYNGLLIDGGIGDDTIHGSTTSFSPAFTVRGGDGNDVISATGRAGTIEGGEGQDTFVLLAGQILRDEGIWITDFSSLDDTLSVSQAALPVGDGDLAVEGAVTINGPGGFDASAELVLLAEDIVGPMTLDSVVAALGEANQAYATGQTSVFVVGDGTETWVLHFTSSGNDAAISAAELSLIGRLAGSVNLTPDDIAWGP
jgi:Ca2+-binding RTX toxin-like protein